MAEELDIERVFKLKYDDLKDELTKRGLQKNGTKSELQERLLQYFTTHDLSAHSLVEESVTTLEEEEEAEESLEILDTPTDLYAPVSLSNVLEDDHEKDILSETLDENTAIQTTLAKVTVAKSIPKKPVAVNLVKIKEVKPKIMSPMAAEDEKKANRTKRFGAAVSIDERKKARLEKFGYTGVTAINKSEPSTLADNDRIKKRAERFGASVDTTVDPVKKLQERKDRFVEVQIKKRQERFGVIQPAPLNDLESRKQKRALKFGVK